MRIKIGRYVKIANINYISGTMIYDDTLDVSYKDQIKLGDIGKVMHYNEKTGWGILTYEVRLLTGKYKGNIVEFAGGEIRVVKDREALDIIMVDEL